MNVAFRKIDIRYLTKPEGGDGDMLPKRFEFTDRPCNKQHADAVV